jgi:hypothetical protein
MHRIRRFSGLLLPCLLACFAPSSVLGQDEGLPPDFLRDHALVVRFTAAAFDGLSANPEATSKDAASKEAISKDAASRQATPKDATSKGASSGPNAGSALVPSPPKSPASGFSPQAPTWTSKSLRYTMSGSPVAIRLAGDDLVVVVQVTPYDHGATGLLVVAQGQVWRRKQDGQLDYRSVFESLYVSWGEHVLFYPLGRQSDGAAPISLEIAVERYGDKALSPEATPSPGALPSGAANGESASKAASSPGPASTGKR